MSLYSALFFLFRRLIRTRRFRSASVSAARFTVDITIMGMLHLSVLTATTITPPIPALLTVTMVQRGLMAGSLLVPVPGSVAAMAIVAMVTVVATATVVVMDIAVVMAIVAAAPTTAEPSVADLSVADSTAVAADFAVVVVAEPSVAVVAAASTAAAVASTVVVDMVAATGNKLSYVVETNGRRPFRTAAVLFRKETALF